MLPVPREHRRLTVLCLLFVLVSSHLTYVAGFSSPPHFFWDENYHVASAQKYLNGVYFMEPHPPLGKLLIALGEKLIDANHDDTTFIGTDYARNPPDDFSLTGYRLMPVLCAWLTAPVLFAIFLIITASPLPALFLSFLYIFDNALIVHLRGAMLEGPLVLFFATTILCFLCILKKQASQKRLKIFSVLFGASFALLLTTKLFGLVLVLLVPAALFALRKDARRRTTFLLLAITGFLPVYIGVWQTHFALGSYVNPSLPDDGFYQASEEYKQILGNGWNGNLRFFPIMLRDSMRFVPHYEKGVPHLDLCKEDENGSPFFLWPIGARTIDYRWETTDGQAYQYLYLQSNPVVWLLALLGVLLAAMMLAASLLLPLKEKLRDTFLLTVFLGLYVAFLAAVSRIDRVMYLYHYFLPLLLGFILFALVLREIHRFGRSAITETRRRWILLGLGALIFLSYQFFRPLTYYEPITDLQFSRRALLRIWELQCVHCPQQSPLAVPRADPS